MKRKSLDIKKKILQILSKRIRKLTYADLERGIGTGFRSIVSNCKELEAFSAIKITKQDKHEANGRPFSQIQITPQGKDFLKNL